MRPYLLVFLGIASVLTTGCSDSSSGSQTSGSQTSGSGGSSRAGGGGTSGTGGGNTQSSGSGGRSSGSGGASASSGSGGVSVGSGAGGSGGGAHSGSSGAGGASGSTSATSGSGGADATDAGADSSATQDITPTCDGQVCTFSWGHFKFSVDAGTGGRVVEFSYDGNNILVSKAEVASASNSDGFGSTFLTSPQSDFGWPPPSALNSDGYSKDFRSCGSRTCLHVASSSFTMKSHSISVEKTFAVNASKDVVEIVYSIVNGGSDAVSFAPWEVTRAHVGGLTFFPYTVLDSGKAVVSGNNMTVIPTTEMDGYSFFAYRASQITSDMKGNADGADKAYVAQVTGDLMLVKSWSAVSASQFAQGEAEVEVYANPDHSYIEVEDQGAYEPIAAGDQRDWAVRWALVKLPSALPSDPSTSVSDATTRQSLEQQADAAATR